VLGARDGWRNELDELLIEAVELQENPGVHSVELWVAPYPDGEELTVAFGTRRYTTDPPSEGVKRPAVLRCEALQALGRVLAILLAWFGQWAIPWALRRAVRTTGTDRVVMEAREGLDFGAPNANNMEAIELAFDIGSGISRAADGLRALVDELENHAREGRFVFSPLGVRFVGRGEARGLSMQAGRSRTLHVEIPTFAYEAVFRGDEILAPLQAFMTRRFDVRSHWGQHVHLTASELRRLWPQSELENMANLARRLDPNGAFSNPALLDPTLGL
jgi:hypothetical protein